MIWIFVACVSAPAPASDRMKLEGPCSPTPDWAGGFGGWPHFVDGGDLEGDGFLELDLTSVDGEVAGTMLLSGDVTVKGVAIEKGRGWQFDVQGSSCWDDDTEDPFTIRLESAVVDAPAGWMEAERNNASVDAWFPDGDGYEYVDLFQGPNVDPLFGGIE